MAFRSAIAVVKDVDNVATVGSLSMSAAAMFWSQSTPAKHSRPLFEVGTVALVWQRVLTNWKMRLASYALKKTLLISSSCVELNISRR